MTEIYCHFPPLIKTRQMLGRDISWCIFCCVLDPCIRP